MEHRQDGQHAIGAARGRARAIALTAFQAARSGSAPRLSAARSCRTCRRAAAGSSTSPAGRRRRHPQRRSRRNRATRSSEAEADRRTPGRCCARCRRIASRARRRTAPRGRRRRRMVVLLGRRQPPVQRHARSRPMPRRGEQQRQILRSVVDEDRDAVAAPRHRAPAQAPGERLDLAASVAIAEIAPSKIDARLRAAYSACRAIQRECHRSRSDQSSLSPGS